VGSRLLVVARGEDFGSFAGDETASIHLLDHPPHEPLPEDIGSVIF